MGSGRGGEGHDGDRQRLRRGRGVPAARRVSGRAAVRSAWAAILKAPNLSLTFESSKVVVSSAGDLAIATGPYQLGMDGPKGQRIEDAGKFVEVWTRVNGEWKVLGNIFNSDKSPT